MAREEIFKSASAASLRPIWNSFATVGVRDSWEKSCTVGTQYSPHTRKPNFDELQPFSQSSLTPTVAITGTCVQYPAQRAQNRREEHVCFWVFLDEQIICKPPWGSVRAAFFQEGRQNHLFAGIDASPLVKRETQHKTYTLHPSRKRERRRSIYGPASDSRDVGR